MLPIRRGAGINQKLLLDYARLVAAGEWCHVFPEGGIWQATQLGGRKDPVEVARIGKLKYGVGKLIAHSPVRPKVVPFHFVGTENAYPQHPETKALSNTLPRMGHKVTVRFGAQLHFDDLIAEHEQVYGPLWHYSASVVKDNATYSKASACDGGEGDEKADDADFHQYWDSKPTDLILYSKITARIESALNELNDASNQKILED